MADTSNLFGGIMADTGTVKRHIAADSGPIKYAVMGQTGTIDAWLVSAFDALTFGGDRLVFNGNTLGFGNG